MQSFVESSGKKKHLKDFKMDIPEGYLTPRGVPPITWPEELKKYYLNVYYENTLMGTSERIKPDAAWQLAFDLKNEDGTHVFSRFHMFLKLPKSVKQLFGDKKTVTIC